jgi:asparagine synthase (glutamine-hydrolysing)
MGFGVPINSRLRGPLGDWPKVLLDESRLHRGRVCETRDGAAKWVENISEARNWQYYLLAVLMVPAWLAKEKQ